MELPVGRFALAAVVAGGLALALPAAAAADSRAQDTPPQAGRSSAITVEGTLPRGQTPTGAPATDAALVIGVGVAALAGAAGLFAAAQYTGRRS